VGILRKPRGAFVGSPDGDVRGYVGAIWNLSPQGVKPRMVFSVLWQSEVVSFPDSMDLESFGCFPRMGYPELRGLDWSSLVSESSGIWTCSWWLSQIGKRVP
jgi:hypothetical protein